MTDEKDTDMNRNQRRHAMSATASNLPPHEGWVLVVRQRFQTNGTIFNRGCLVPVEQLGPNYQSLLDGGFVRWVPPSKAVGAVQPVVASAPTPVLPNPKVEIVPDGDPVNSWRKSLALMTDRYGGDYGRAKNALEADKAGGDLFKLATRVLAERNAIANRTPGRRIAAL